MTNAATHRRPAFTCRPWITGKLYDDMARDTVLHLDAYVVAVGALNYLIIEARQGGRVPIAADAYMIEDDGVTPVWDVASVKARGVAVTWTRHNDAWMGPLHLAVIHRADGIGELFAQRWPRVTLQAHYVGTRETDTEITGERNRYVGRKEYAPRVGREVRENAPKRPRGRPRKPVRNAMPDIL